MLEAAAKRKDKTVAAKLAKFEAADPTENFFALEPYLETLEGGDVAKGKKSFRKRGHQLRALPSGGQPGW